MGGSVMVLEEMGIEPPTLWLVDNPLYLLSHSHETEEKQESLKEANGCYDVFY